MKLVTALAGGLMTVGVAAALVATNPDPAPAPAQKPSVSKIADCQHRGVGHRQKHGGLEDDRYHRFHGEPVTCQDKDTDRGIDYYDGKDADDHGPLDERDRRPEQRESKDDQKDSPFHRRDTSVKPNLFDLIS